MLLNLIKSDNIENLAFLFNLNREVSVKIFSNFTVRATSKKLVYDYFFSGIGIMPRKKIVKEILKAIAVY